MLGPRWDRHALARFLLGRGPGCVLLVVLPCGRGLPWGGAAWRLGEAAVGSCRRFWLELRLQLYKKGLKSRITDA